MTRKTGAVRQCTCFLIYKMLPRRAYAEPCYQRVQRGELKGHVGPRVVQLRRSKGVLLSSASGHKIRNRHCRKYNAATPAANTGRKFWQQLIYPMCSSLCGICFAFSATFCLLYMGQLCAFKFSETTVWKGLSTFLHFWFLKYSRNRLNCTENALN